MKTVGLIVEYNPLHFGHVYHFEQSKLVSGADAVVAVMSGHFLQRGEPAVVNKWARAEMALRMGVDLVIELPVAFSAQPAEWFAYGAVSALEASGVVNCVCFGSESGQLDWLKRLARIMRHEPPEFQRFIKQQLKRGISYPAAYSAAAKRYVQDVPEEQLAKPNNILGLHYLIALERLNSPIVPLTIARRKADYHQTDITDGRIASATAIRRLLFEKRQPEAAAAYVPVYTADVISREWHSGRAPVSWESFLKPLMIQLLHATPEQLSEFAEVTEGLEYRIKQALSSVTAGNGLSLEELFARLKTKRYTRTKLQRTLLRILLQHRKHALDREVLRDGVPYLRILGFSEKGKQLLKRMKSCSRVPVITNVTSETVRQFPMLELDVRASSVYALAYSPLSSRDLFRDYYEAPLRL